MENMPTFDSPEFRQLRNQKLMEWIGDQHAIVFFLMVTSASEFFDDLIDRDKPVTDETIVGQMFSLLIDMHTNPFFSANKQRLLPIMETAANAWLDSNELQKSGPVGASRAFVLRDLTIEVLLATIGIVRGRAYLRSVSCDVRNFFVHETLEQFKESL